MGKKSGNGILQQIADFIRYVPVIRLIFVLASVYGKDNLDRFIRVLTQV